MNVVGIDIGFGFTKATNGRDSIVFKSIFGEASDIQYREQLLGGPRAEEHLHVEIGNDGYFVGELAERQSNTRSFTLDQDQFIGTFARIMACTALSHLAERAEQVLEDERPVTRVAQRPACGPQPTQVVGIRSRERNELWRLAKEPVPERPALGWAPGALREPVT